jgi:hypothetical protein
MAEASPGKKPHYSISTNIPGMVVQACDPSQAGVIGRRIVVEGDLQMKM